MMVDRELFVLGEIGVGILGLGGLTSLLVAPRRPEPGTPRCFDPERLVPIATAAPGDLVLHGAAEPIEALVRAPLVDELVLAYELAVTSWTVGHGGAMRRSGTQHLREGTLFAIRDDDDTARIEVDFRAGTFDLARTGQREGTYGVFGEHSLSRNANVAAIVARLGARAGVRFDVALRTVVAGDRLAYDGRVIRTFDAAGSLRMVGGHGGCTHVGLGRPEDLFAEAEAAHDVARGASLGFGLLLIAGALALQWSLL